LAREILKGDLDRNSGFVWLWIALAKLELRSSNIDGARALLDQAEQKLGQKSELTLAIIQHAAAVGDSAEPRQLLVLQEQKIGAFPQELRLPLIRALATAHARIRSVHEA